MGVKPINIDKKNIEGKKEIFIFSKSDVKKYGSHPNLQEGTIEECLDAVAKIYLV